MEGNDESFWVFTFYLLYPWPAIVFFLEGKHLVSLKRFLFNLNHICDVDRSKFPRKLVGSLDDYFWNYWKIAS